MRPELHELLEAAAGESKAGLDIELVGRIAGRERFRRRGGLAAAVATVIALTWAGAVSISLPGTSSTQNLGSATFAPSTVELPPSLLGPLARGTYVAEAFRPQFSFRIDSDGWSAKLLSSHRVTLVFRRGLYLDVMVWDKVYEEDARGELEVKSLPSGIEEWLRRHPRLNVGYTASMMVGEAEAPGLELKTLSSLARSAGGCATRRCVPLARTRGSRERFGIEDGHSAALYLIDTAEGTVVLTLTGPSDAFDDYTAEARSLIKTMKFALSDS